MHDIRAGHDGLPVFPTCGTHPFPLEVVCFHRVPETVHELSGLRAMQLQPCLTLASFASLRLLTLVSFASLRLLTLASFAHLEAALAGSTISIDRRNSCENLNLNANGNAYWCERHACRGKHRPRQNMSFHVTLDS